MAYTIGEYHDIFLEEADEQLQELNQNLLELEKNTDDIETINNIFRTAHSLKSSAAFVGLNDLSDLAHMMENLLQGIRDKTMEVTHEIIDILFQCFDVISSIIESVASGGEPTQDLTGLMKRIQEIGEKSKAGDYSRGSKDKDTDKEDVSLKTQYTKAEKQRIMDCLKKGKTCCEVEVYIDPSAAMRWIKGHLIINNLKQFSEVLKTVPSVDELNEGWEEDIFKVILLTDQSAEDVRKACEVDLVTRIDMKNIGLIKKKDKLALKFLEKETLLEEKKKDEAESLDEDEKKSSALLKDEIYMDEEDQERTECEKKSEDKKVPVLKIVKVSVDKLDLLLNNVGELVIANSGFYRLLEEMKRTNIDKSMINEFKNRIDQMSRIAKDLQSGIMKTRMVPIGRVFTRFNRLVRDLAKEFDKNVNLVIKGEDTELDKKVIDAIGEPLMHLIRNSIDHGVETSKERNRLGKGIEARVILNAFQGGNQIFVEVSDDGRGLNIEKIKEKALNKEFVTPEVLSNMDDEDIYDFIFYPGFSTANVVTDISGRGVGMNVVKETVNELNGSVRIETEPGMGTTFTLTFPLTLAIIPAIMVKVSNEIYAVPLADVIETVKISHSDIATIEGREVINLRGEILSLLRLDVFVGMESVLEDLEKIPVVVVGFGNRKIGLIVDSLVGKQEIVIKSLEENYASVEGLSGASILGDGNICLILDIASMINKVISDEEMLLRQRKTERIEAETRIVEESLMIDKGDETGREQEYISFDNERGELISNNIEETTQPSIEYQEEQDNVPAEYGMEAYTEEEGVSVASYKEEMVESTMIADKQATSYADHDYIAGREELGEDEGGEAESFIYEKDEKVMEEEGREDTLLIEEQPSEVDSTPDISEDIKLEEPEVEELDSDVRMELEEEIPLPEVLEGEERFQAEEDGSSESKEEMDSHIKETLDDFRKELEDNIKSTTEISEFDDHITKALQIEEQDMDKIGVIANIGITNAAESLSKILNKRVSLSIPEVEIIPVERIPRTLGDIDSVYIGVYMPVVGDIDGSILFSISDESGFELIDMLYGDVSGKTKELNEDGESALKEVTNIIGSSVINIMSEKIDLAVKPLVPTVIHDYIQSTLDSMLMQNNIVGDYALYMDTIFYYQDDSVLGKMLILTGTESIKKVIEKLRE